MACVFVEVLIICALVIMVGWNKGVKEWFEQFEQPVLKEVPLRRPHPGKISHKL